MKKACFIGGLLISLMFYGCGNSKLTPEELIQKIEKSGHKVQKDGVISSIAQNSEVQFWLLIDDHKISAYCFDTQETAKIKSESFENGYSNGYWAFDYVDDETVKTLNEALEL